jgi:hypothetical protein
VSTLAVVFLLTGGTLTGPYIGNQSEDALMLCMRVLVEQGAEPKYVGATLDVNGNPYGFVNGDPTLRCFTAKEWPHG